jgi:hypothetical protein
MLLEFLRRLYLPLVFLLIAAAPSPAATVSALPDAPLPSASSAGAVIPLPPVGTPEALALREGHLIIPRLDAAPKLANFAGSGLSGPARRMLHVSNFVQRYPSDGDAATQLTTAYLGYTHDYLYVAFVCGDKDPSHVRAHMLARDSLSDDDNVQVMLDTFHDQRRAFVFAVNPLGIQADALYSEQTGYDFSFDTVWDTWGRRTSGGYMVLMRIPFASLYFAQSDPGVLRTWGIILTRNVSHTNENDYWPRSNHDIAGRLTQDQKVDGFRDVEHGQNLQFQPYVMARNLRQLNSIDPANPYFESKHLQGYTGLDAKFILHNSLVLDTTINPDFSQVGIDNPAVPNQRFPPYFAEVRPFFIENSSYFVTPLNLYYTNNIVKPQFGARLTGKLGKWAVGLLDVDDRSPGQSVPPSDPEYNKRAGFYLGRINRDVGPLSNVGLIYADREYHDSFNRAGGLDYRLRLKNRWTITGQGLTSQTQNLSNSTAGEQYCANYALSCSGQAWVQEVSYSDLHWNWWTAYSDTSAGFVTDTGFFQRPDVRQPNGRISYTFRPEHGPILSHGPSVYSERIWDHTGLPLDFYLNPSYNINFQHSTSLSASMELGQDRLRPIDYGALPGNVEYHSNSAGVSFYTAPVPYVAIGASFYKGTTINFSPPGDEGPGPVAISTPHVNIEVKPTSGLDLQNSYVYSHFTRLDTGALVYDNHEFISRWNYQVTKEASLNLIGQYISTLPHADSTGLSNSRTLFADALFTYMLHPGTALYVGYIGNFANLDRALCTREVEGACNPSDPILPTTTSSMMNDGKNIYVKLSYLLRF